MACGFWLKYRTVHYILGLRGKKGLKMTAKDYERKKPTGSFFDSAQLLPMQVPTLSRHSLWFQHVHQNENNYLTQTAQCKVSFPQRSIAVMTWNKPVSLFRCPMPHKSQSIHLTVNFKSHPFDVRAWFKLFCTRSQCYFLALYAKKSCTIQFTI